MTPATPRRPHPSIQQVGRLVPTAAGLLPVGWHVGPCAAVCRCHLHPTQHRPRVLEGVGLLGLVSYDETCTCCVPWTVPELADLLRDLHNADKLEPIT